MLLSKKGGTLLASLQNEILKCVKDTEDKMKIYHKDATALSAALKALEKGKGGKKSDKLKDKVDVAQKKSALSRNEYILALDALNHSLERYFNIELPQLASSMDSNFHRTFSSWYVPVMI